MLLISLVVLLLPLAEAVPSRVTGVMLSVVPGEAAITVTWEKPSGGQPITGYEAEYGINHYSTGATTVPVEGADTLTVTITGLQREMIYVVHVRAVSDVGNGLYNEFPDQRIAIPNVPPQVSVVSGQAATIRVTWTKSTIGETAIIGYDVQYKTSSTQDWDGISTARVTGENAVTVDLTNLERGTTYNVRVRAVSNTVIGPYSQEATYTLPRLPPQVTGVSLSVVSGEATIRVTWTKPSVEGTFSRYEVQHKTSSQGWNGISRIPVTGENTLTVDLPSLERGTTYSVRVRAVSNVGNGPTNSAPQATITLPILPPQVTGGLSLSVVSGQATIRVAWIKPTVEGTFTRYDVQHKASSQEWNGISTTPVTGENTVTVDLTNLQRGTTYNVRVRAVSNAGNGPYSAEATYTLPGLPSQVTGVSLSVVSGEATIRVTWTKPSVEGAFTRYDVQPKTSSQNWGDLTARQVTGENTVTVDFQSLQRGTTYNVRVRAVSDAGNGPYSAEATSTVPRLPPQVSGVSLSVVSGQATIRLTWTKPSVEGTFTRYDVQSKISSQSWNAASTRQVTGENTETVDLTNLLRGTTYNVRIRAVSNAGNGDYSAEATSTVPRLPPQVTGVSLSVVSGQAAIRVSWNNPIVQGTFMRYDIQYRSSSQSYITRTLMDKNTVTIDLPGLQRGTTYTVRVRAVSNAGDGPYSAEDTFTLPGFPPQVTGVSLSVVSGQATIRVTWTKPSVEGTFTRYDVQPKTSSQNWGDLSTRQVTGENTVTVDFSSLQRGTTYNVRVRAVSNAGNGPYSEEATSTVPRPPAAVSGVHVTVMDGVASIPITVTWIPPQSDRPITRYQVDFSELESDQPQVTSVNAPPAAFTGTSGVSYKVRVRAESTAGFGGWSPHTIIASPSVPTGVTATSSNTSTVTITWNDESFKYRISAQREGSSERPPQDPVSPPQDPVSPPHTITGLDSNTGYTITVEAYSPLGQAEMNINGYTLPEAPSSLNLEVVSSTVIRVTWTAPPNADRLPLTYLTSYQFAEFDSDMEEASTQPVELTGLHPFTEYTVRVQARNTGGQLGVTVSGKSTTLSAAPSSPPQSVLIVDALKTHNSLTCAWQLPVEADRNGIITSYFIIVTRGSGTEQQPVGNFTKLVDYPSFDAPTHLRYNMTSLVAQTLYSFRIAAVTSGGTGVFSDSLARRTNHDLYVSMLTIRVDSDTSSTISWAAPEGVDSVTSYTVYYGVYLIGTFMSRTIATSTTSQQLASLTPETPIEVSVIPNTAQGPGGSVSRIFFTREGVPTDPVNNVTAMWINSVSLRVSWTPLSLHEARGWPLYTVLVDSTAARTTRATITGNTSSSTVDVDGLDPSTWYSVRVQVGTSAGTSLSLITDPIDVSPANTTTGPTEDGNAVIIASVLVVIILLVIAIAITVVVIVLVVRFRHKLGKSFSPTQSESEVEIKGGKGHELNLSSLPGGREAYDSREDLEGGTQNGKVETNTYETVTTSMGAAVAKSDFASHVTMMHKERDSGFEKEYLSIINDPEGIEAIAKANKLKNRYINIHTFDHSRVVLTVPDDKGSDYINASYIDGYKRESAYIASQGPTPSTITDFWQMIVDHKAPVIVMLTKVEEKGKKKCEQYWEETLNTKVDKGRGIQVTTVKITPFADYEVREFQVTSSSSPSVQPLKVKHFLYTAWPDHGVPQHPSSLVRFTHKVRRAYQNSAAPIIVHCSAGVGRTGTYLTIDAMLQRIKEVDSLNVFEFVVEMRSKRTFMVQNQDQYAFIHDALCDYITCGDTSVAAHELRRVIIEMEATDPKTKRSGFDNHFEFLESLSKSPCSDDVKYAKKQSISKKNRFKDRFPYSNSHMRVPGKSPSNGSDYINASYVDSYSRKNAFIAAQTPLSSTVADFWELLWQFKPPTVVVLTSADDDKDGADFWPTQEEGVADYGVAKVNHKATMPCSDYDRHTLEVVDRRKDKCTPYNLKVFHFKTWSSNSTPHFSSLLDMIGEIDKCTVGSAKPLVVACSDGISRTGVFVSVMSEVERVKAESEVDLFQTIKAARAKRPYFVYTAEQYKLCFDILQAYLDSFDTYANFKV